MIDEVVYSWWPIFTGLAACAFLADWLLTVAGARAYRKVRDRWAVEGSYEMNPAWVAAVESGRWLTGRVIAVAFLVALLLGALAFVIGLLEDEFEPLGASSGFLFALAAGAMLLVQAPTLMNHAANLGQFRAMADSAAVSGRLILARWFALGQTGAMYLRFAFLWLALGALSFEGFFLGGAFGCALLGLRFRRLAGQARIGALQPSAETPASTAR